MSRGVTSLIPAKSNVRVMERTAAVLHHWLVLSFTPLERIKERTPFEQEHLAASFIYRAVFKPDIKITG